MYNPTDVAERIKATAKTQGIAVQDVLKACNLNKNVISTMLSRGSMPKTDTIAVIADYLDCSVDYLLGRTDNVQSHLGAAVAADDEAELLAAYRSCDNFGKCAVMETAQREAARTKAQLTKAK